MFPREKDFEREIAAAHRAFPMVPVNIIKAIIAAESGFDPQAFRAEPQLKDASRGLMQLLFTTAKSVGYAGRPDGLFLPAVNIYYGTKHLANLVMQLREWDRAISAYNGGLRPELGFGARAPRPLRICRARAASGQCVRWETVAAGQFANQAYVDRVRRYHRYFVKGPAKAGPLLLLLPLVGALALKGGGGLL